MDLGKKFTVGILLFSVLGIGSFTFVKKFARIQDLQLAGVEVREDFPTFSLKVFWSGEFQTRMDKWIAANLGLRAAFVRLDNQVNLSAFSEISSKYGSKIILGKDKWLYEKIYIDTLNNRDEVLQDVLEDKVRSLKRLQELLESNGIHFLFLITPSKASIYPEYINGRYTIPKNLKKQTNYDKVVPLLQEHGVRYLDGRRYLSELKGKGLYPVYYKSGTHWSYYSVCLFTLEFISSLENMTKQEMKKFQVDRIRMRKRPFGSDNDLASLANILFGKSLYGKYYYPVTSSVGAEDVVRPRMLFVGGSYVGTLFHYLEHHQVYSERDWYVYYKENATYPAGTFETIDKKNLDLKREILAKDIVVIETNEQQLPLLGFGFIEDALKALSNN